MWMWWWFWVLVTYAPSLCDTALVALGSTSLLQWWQCNGQLYSMALSPGITEERSRWIWEGRSAAKIQYLKRWNNHIDTHTEIWFLTHLSLVVAEMCSVSALISIGTVLGKTNPVHLILIALIEVFSFVLNDWVLRMILKVNIHLSINIGSKYLCSTIVFCYFYSSSP